MISAATDRVVAQAEVGVGPIGIAYDARMGEMFVANSYSNNVSVLNDTSDSVVASVTTNETPETLAFDNTTGDLFVEYGWGPWPNVSVISAASNSIVATIDVGSPCGMVYDYVLAEVFVSDCGGDVTVISGSNDTVVETIPASPNNLPLGIAYDPARGEVFVAWNYSGTISVIADTGGVVDTIPSVHEFADLFNEEELDMAYDSDQGEMIFAIADGGPSVLVINDTSNAVPGRIPLASSPGAQVFDTGTDQLFVIDGNQVDAISGSTDHLVATVPVGWTQSGFVHSGLGEIFVTNSVSNNVSVISDRTDSVVDWIGVGIEPTG